MTTRADALANRIAECINIALIADNGTAYHCTVCGFVSDDPDEFLAHPNWHNSVPSLRDGRDERIAEFFERITA